MKIVITGGAGYIGSHTIIEVLGKTNWEVISIDNYVNSTPSVYERIKSITGKSVKQYDSDLCDKAKTKKIFMDNPGIQGIIHFAALKSVPESIEQPELYFKNNIGSLENILECVSEFQISNFIFSSSCSVYGNIDKLPVDEETPLQESQSPYGETKRQGEILIQRFASVHSHVNFIALRYFNPVGAHPSGKNGEASIKPVLNIVPAITETAIGIRKSLHVFGNDYNTRDGSCIRDYIHVIDIADAHILALQYLLNGSNKMNYEIFNLGSGKGVTVFEAIKSFEKVSGQKLNYEIVPRRSGDVEAIYSNSEKAEKLLGWKPKFNIDQMMESAWKWQLSHNK